VFAQDLNSLFLNKTLELYFKTMENIIFEFSLLYILYYVLYIIYYIWYIVYTSKYTICSILCILHSILYIVNCQTKAIKNFHILKK
jgi:hypothetical protein